MGRTSSIASQKLSSRTRLAGENTSERSLSITGTRFRATGVWRRSRSGLQLRRSGGQSRFYLRTRPRVRGRSGYARAASIWKRIGVKAAGAGVSERLHLQRSQHQIDYDEGMFLDRGCCLSAPQMIRRTRLRRHLHPQRSAHQRFIGWGALPDSTTRRQPARERLRQHARREAKRGYALLRKIAGEGRGDRPLAMLPCGFSFAPRSSVSFLIRGAEGETTYGRLTTELVAPAPAPAVDDHFALQPPASREPPSDEAPTVHL